MENAKTGITTLPFANTMSSKHINTLFTMHQNPSYHLQCHGEEVQLKVFLNDRTHIVSRLIFRHTHSCVKYAPIPADQF